jgi:hypothetical protein
MPQRRRTASRLAALTVVLASCASDEPATQPADDTSPTAGPAEASPLRNAYFGDLHVHTKYSFDAFTFGTAAGPDEAYEYARGGKIRHPAGYDLELLSGPLDFMAVADHAMLLGVVPAMSDSSLPVSQHPLSKQMAAAQTIPERTAAFTKLVTMARADQVPAEIDDHSILRSAWQEIIAAAERHNDPGSFTTFIAYEFSSSLDGQNLHRNVIFRGSEAPEQPFSRLDSPNPEDLWDWLDAQRQAGMDSLAIPHNMNMSDGLMFKLATFDDGPLDSAYAEQRMRNEPIVEMSQVKGTSEVHPSLSPNDRWADFELMPLRVASPLPSKPPGSYVREAYLNGLVLEERQGFDPFHFGMIGSTDTHNAGPTPEENNFAGKTALLDGTPERRASVPQSDGTYFETANDLRGASGLAGVWAEQNTRESLFLAMRRKETFATSGTRIQVRFFAGYDYAGDLVDDPEMIAKSYEGGVPMGADLAADGERAPAFVVWAARDANSAALDRVQIVKGWVDSGRAQEQLFDVACADGRQPDPATYLCEDGPATVDLADCGIGPGVGAPELATVWMDPLFDASQRAFYYVRVLENPTCRWSTWDAIRAGVAPRDDLPATIQERAWSSPIWYVPR